MVNSWRLISSCLYPVPPISWDSVLLLTVADPQTSHQGHHSSCTLPPSWKTIINYTWNVWSSWNGYPCANHQFQWRWNVETVVLIHQDQIGMSSKMVFSARPNISSMFSYGRSVDGNQKGTSRATGIQKQKTATPVTHIKMIRSTSSKTFEWILSKEPKSRWRQKSRLIPQMLLLMKWIDWT